MTPEQKNAITDIVKKAFKGQSGDQTAKSVIETGLIFEDTSHFMDYFGKYIHYLGKN
jgi:hypothetical protein